MFVLSFRRSENPARGGRTANDDGLLGWPCASQLPLLLHLRLTQPAREAGMGLSAGSIAHELSRGPAAWSLADPDWLHRGHQRIDWRWLEKARLTQPARSWTGDFRGFYYDLPSIFDFRSHCRWRE